jgi:hypothetical protein
MPLNPSDILVGQIDASEFDELGTKDMNSLRTDTLSVDKCDLTWSCMIPGDKLKAAIQYVLGVDYVDVNLKLRRTTPMFHPVHCWSYAKILHINGIGWNGPDTAAVIWDDQSTPAKWKKYKLDISFDMRKYNVKTDDDITTEDQRYVWRRSSNDVQIVTQNNGIYKYVAPGNAADGNTSISPLPIVRREGSGVKVSWYCVPLEFIQDGQDAFPTKFIQAIGKVNLSEIWGCPAQTLYCSEIDYSNRYPSPVVTDIAGEPYMLVDVEMKFNYFLQVTGDIGTTTPAETQRGHNMQLFTDGKYYAVATTAGKQPFTTVDFAKLFTHWNDPF